MTKRDIIICHDAEELARKASEQFVALAGAAIDRSGRFNRGTTWSCQKLSASEGSAMSGYNYESFGQCDIDAPDFGRSPRSGRRRRIFNLPDLDGNPVSLSSFAGKKHVLLEFGSIT